MFSIEAGGLRELMRDNECPRFSCSGKLKGQRLSGVMRGRYELQLCKGSSKKGLYSYCNAASFRKNHSAMLQSKWGKMALPFPPPYSIATH